MRISNKKREREKAKQALPIWQSVIYIQGKSGNRQHQNSYTQSSQDIRICRLPQHIVQYHLNEVDALF